MADIGIKIRAFDEASPVLQKVAAETRAVGAAADSAGGKDPFAQSSLSAKQLAFSLRGIPAQFTDIAVSLQAGQAPLTVLLQQGGQLKDMFGGVAPAAKALGGYILGLIGPYTIAATAAAALGYAWYKGSQEAHEYSKAIILSGNAAGTTVAQMQAAAQHIGATSNASTSAAAEALTAFVRNGDIASNKMESFASTAVSMQKLTGQAVEETVKQFAELGKDPLGASLKLNDATHYLTASVYEQIKSLKEQGKTLEAGALAQQAYGDAMNSRMPQLKENLGTIQTLWTGIAGSAKWAWEQMLNVGRSVDPATALRNSYANAKQDLARAEGGVELYNGELAALKIKVPLLKEGVAIAERAATMATSSAQQAAEQNKQLGYSVAWAKINDEYMGKALQKQKAITEATQAYRNKTQDPQAALPANVLTGINKKFEDFGPANISLTSLIDYYERAQAIITGGEKVAHDTVESAYKRNLISAQDYYKTLEAVDAINNQDLQATVKGEIAAVQQSGIALTEKASKIAGYNKELETLRAAEVAIHTKANNQIAALSDKADLAAAEAHNKYLTSLMAGTDKLNAETAKLREDTAELGLNKDAIGELRAAEIEHQATVLEGIAIRALDYAGWVDGISLGEAEYNITMKNVQALKDKAAAARGYGIKEASVEAVKATNAEWKKGWDETDRIAREAFTGWADNGVSMADSIGKALRKSLTSALYDIFIRPYALQIYTSLTGGPVGAAGSAGNTLGAASGLNSLYNIATGPMSISGMTNSFAQTGMGQSLGLWSKGNNPSAAGLSESGQSLSNGLTTAASILGYADAFSAAAGGKWGEAAGEAIGTYLLPGVGTLIGKAIGAALDSAFGGETRAGGGYAYSAATGTTFTGGPSGGQIMGTDVQKAITDTVGTINNLLTGVGSAARITGFQAGLESSGNNRGGVFSGGTFSTGATFGESGKGSNYDGTLYEKTSTQSPDAQTALANFATDLTQATLEALQAATDIPKTISDILKGQDIEALTAQAATDLLKTIDAVVTTVVSFNAVAKTLPFENLKNLSFDLAAGLIAAAGGIDKLGANLATYYDKFYSADEKRAQTLKNVTSTMDTASVGNPFHDAIMQMMAGAASTSQTADSTQALRDTFRHIAEAQDVTTASGQQTYAALMSVAGAFDGLEPAATAVAAASTAAADAVKAAADALKILTDTANTNASLQSTLYGLMDAVNGTHLQQEFDRANTRADITSKLGVSTDQTTLTLQNQIYAQQDLAAASADAAAAAAAAATAMANMQSSISAAQQALINTGVTTSYAIAQQTAQVAWEAFKAAIPQAASMTVAQIATYAADPANHPGGANSIMSGAQWAATDAFIAAANIWLPIQAAATNQTTAATAATSTYANTVADVDTVLQGLTNTNKNLTDQYNKLTLSDAAYRDTQIAGMTALQVAMYDSNAAIQSSIDAFNAQTAAAKAAADSFTSLRDKYADPLTKQTASEQIAQKLGLNVNDVLAMSASDARSLIKSLADDFDMMGTAGQPFLLMLQSLSPAFDVLISGVDTWGDAIKTAYANVQSALAGVGSAVQALADKASASETALQGSKDNISNALFAAQDTVTALQQKAADGLKVFTKSIDDFLYTIDPATSSTASLASLKAQLSATAVLASGGDTNAQGRLISEAQATDAAAKANSTSALEYARSEAFIRSTLETVKTAIGVSVVDPAVDAKAALLKAQQDVIAYTSLALATGASITRTSESTADKVNALLLANSKAFSDNTGAQADYQAALIATKDLQLKVPGTLDALNKALDGYDKANIDFAKTMHDAGTATGIAVSGPGGWLEKLGLAGKGASDFVDALNAALAGLTHVVTPPPPTDELAKLISGIYQTYFGRTASKDEIKWWEQAKDPNGALLTATNMGYNITNNASGADAKTMATLGLSPISNPTPAVDPRVTAIQQAYQDYFGRTPNSGEVAWWAGQTQLANSQMAYNISHNAAAGSPDAVARMRLQGFATGTNYLQSDGAFYGHQGETITPRPYVDIESAARKETNALIARLLASNERLEAKFTALQTASDKTAKNTGNTDNTLTRVSRGGVSLAIKAEP